MLHEQRRDTLVKQPRARRRLIPRRQSVRARVRTGPEVLQHLPRSQIATIDGHQVVGSAPRATPVQLVCERQPERSVPIRCRTGHRPLGVPLAIEIDQRPARSIARIDDVRQLRGQALAGRTGRRNAVGACLGRSESHVEPVAVMPERKVSLGAVLRQRDDPRRAGLVRPGRTKPGFDRDFA